MMPMPGAASARPASYEFTESENETLDRTANFARWWGMISAASGVLLVLLAALVLVVLQGASMVSSASGGPKLPMAMIGTVVATVGPLGLVYVVCGVLYLQTGNALRAVVTTEGNDMPLLMGALRTLSRALLIEAAATILAFVVGFAAGLLGVKGHV